MRAQRRARHDRIAARNLHRLEDEDSGADFARGARLAVRLGRTSAPVATTAAVAHARGTRTTLARLLRHDKTDVPPVFVSPNAIRTAHRVRRGRRTESRTATAPSACGRRRAHHESTSTATGSRKVPSSRHGELETHSSSAPGRRLRRPNSTSTSCARRPSHRPCSLRRSLR